ncbi:gp121R [Rabbit fibroma virus]|uniref:Protein OPG161 n=1 Tax=Rabbit fibroma virus (strain Kasza) TaxID=10272 RepID=Q9Q8V7_RFVKA|nr:gp121R [Rabbit fibroma virus]AAF18004.1 gp121R [Rabbit fibroma virus]
MSLQENDVEDSKDEGAAFIGSTIYGNKLKKKHLIKKVKCVSILLRVSIVTSIVSLMAITAILALQCSTCDVVKTSAHISSSINQYESECKGIVFDSACYTLHKEPKTFYEASEDCANQSAVLPFKTLKDHWMWDYLEGTWGVDGYGIVELVDLNTYDVSVEMRKYFCVKSFT